MPRGSITKHEMLSKVYKLKDELRNEDKSDEARVLANKYLNQVLDYIETFVY